jgi:2-C-methyl-D-erythritol 4-phosphate cytidylyltransferase
MTDMDAVHALVPAAGRGERLGGLLPKQYVEIAGKAVLQHALEALAGHPGVRRITVALSPDDLYFSQLDLDLPIHVDTVEGGDSRAESVLNGLRYIDRIDSGAWALVHDAARPCLPHECLDRLLTVGLAHELGAILAIPVRDTLKLGNDRREVEKTVSRDALWAAQTPQLFRAGMLADALEAAMQKGESPTDESSVMESGQSGPALVRGSAFNLKITYPEDVALAEAWLASHGRIPR